MDYQNILVTTHNQVGVVQLNRPKALNALNSELLVELLDALKTFDTDDNIGCMIIVGNEKAFAAGADIKQMAQATVPEMMAMPFLGYWDDLLKISKPIIAAVGGWCLGGGMELALACDMIIASDAAKFGQPEINLGIIPGAGGTQRLTRAVGKVLAMEMVLNDRKLSAEEARQVGLVNHVYPLENYLDEAIRIGNEIATRAPIAVRLGKEAVNQAFETSLTEGVYVERRLFHMLFATEDQKEGMAAFIGKRPAEWKGK